jgi:hypothetical protein
MEAEIGGEIMVRGTNEIMTRSFLDKNSFIPEDWQFNPATMYFEHKTKRVTVCTAGKDDKREVPYMLSAKYVHSLGY